MSKYNLMEDLYGSNWAKIAEDKYLLSPSDCTLGKFEEEDSIFLAISFIA